MVTATVSEEDVKLIVAAWTALNQKMTHEQISRSFYHKLFTNNPSFPAEYSVKKHHPELTLDEMLDHVEFIPVRNNVVSTCVKLLVCSSNAEESFKLRKTLAQTHFGRKLHPTAMAPEKIFAPLAGVLAENLSESILDEKTVNALKHGLDICMTDIMHLMEAYYKV